jgi:N-acetylmuramoyl-L-alanine amidase
MKYTALFVLIISTVLLTHPFPHASFTLMLDPAGDAQYPGRIIEDSFERGITLQCVEELQNVISKRFPHVRVVLTRFPGETKQPLQNANFANRLDVDLYISIHCYHETKPKSQLYLYYFSQNDMFVGQPSAYSLCPYDKAHLFSIKTTKAWGTTMERVLRDAQYGHLFVFRGLYTIPFAPLIGIKKPAIAFEIGLKQKENWKLFIEPIVASLTPLIESRAS